MIRYRYTVTLDAKGTFVSAVSDQTRLREWAIEEAQGVIERGDFIVVDVQVAEVGESV